MTLERFHFTHNDVEYNIPKFSDLPMGVIRKSRKADDDGDRVFIILEAVMGEGSAELDAVDDMSAEEFKNFLGEWTEGVSLPEGSSSES